MSRIKTILSCLVSISIGSCAGIKSFFQRILSTVKFLFMAKLETLHEEKKRWSLLCLKNAKEVRKYFLK